MKFSILSKTAIAALFISQGSWCKDLSENLKWNTYIDFETESTRNSEFNDFSEARIQTFDTGFDYHGSNFSTHLYANYRDDITDGIELAQAQIYWNPISYFFLGAGRSYLPFGYIETLASTYAPTADFGYTIEDNVQLGWDGEHIYAVAYSYKSDLEIIDKEKSENGHGFDIAYIYHDDLFRIGYSYLSNMADVDLFSLVFDELEEIETAIPISAAYFSLYWKNLALVGETMQATKTYPEDALFGFLSEKKPSFNNFELAYYFNDHFWLVGGLRTTKDAEAFGIPKSAVLLGFSKEFYEGSVRWSVEFQDGEEYPEIKAGRQFSNQFKSLTVQTEFYF